MAGTTKLNYDELQAIIKSLQGEEEEMKALLSQTKSKVEGLHNNQWVGQGADKFFNEMEGVVLPKMGKLVYALDVAGHVLNQIMQTIHQADEETKGFFGNLGI
ncbi:MAG: WXG100 family type VII secretion target [Chloroflexi bacterium]|nr:WXG100 family type VII secretion target [Chloroflexota bacterium]